MSWVKPTDEVVAHLRRDAAHPGETADWLVVLRTLPDGTSSVVRLHGRTGARSAKETVTRHRTADAARTEAEGLAAAKRRDGRYREVGRDEAPAARSQDILLSGEVWDDTWSRKQDRLIPLGLMSTAELAWRLPAGASQLRFVRSAQRILLAGSVSADDQPGRVIQACVAHFLGGTLADGSLAHLFGGTPTAAASAAIDPAEWIDSVKALLSTAEFDLAADFGLLPRRIDYSALAAAQATRSPWSGLV